MLLGSMQWPWVGLRGTKGVHTCQAREKGTGKRGRHTHRGGEGDAPVRRDHVLQVRVARGGVDTGNELRQARRGGQGVGC